VLGSSAERTTDRRVGRPIASWSPKGGKIVNPRTTSRYFAFISYTKADQSAALWLHDRLERYVVPPDLVGRPRHDGAIPARMQPVFMDLTDLSAGPNLNNALFEALSSSLHLIVLCSRASARSHHVNEEVRVFRELHGVQRVIAVLVDAGDGDQRDIHEHFPHELTTPDPASPHRRLEPIAADLRGSGDARHSGFLKVVSGLLDVPLDEIVKRERVRTRSLRRRKSLAAAAMVLLASAGLFLAFDAGVFGKFGDPVRRAIDDIGMSILRRPAGAARIAAQCQEVSNDMLRAVFEGRSQSGIFPSNVGIGADDRDDAWATAQVLAAGMRCSGLSQRVAQRYIECVRTLMRPPFIVEYLGRPVLQNDEMTVPRTMPGEWLLIAIALGIKRADLFSAEERTELVGYAQQIARIIEPQRCTHDGGWNMFFGQLDAEAHDTYSTALGLLAMLDARDAELKLTWNGRPEDKAIVQTAEWFVDSFVSTPGNTGWRRYANDRELDIYEGLNFQIFALLFRTERAGLMTIEPAIRAAAAEQIRACVGRPFEFPVTSAEYDTLVATGSRDMRIAESINFLWHPWGIECATEWLRTSRSGDHGSAVNGVLLARDHMILELGPSAYLKYIDRGGRRYIAAEFLYAIGGASSTAASR
jgi:hypothetical protein